MSKAHKWPILGIALALAFGVAGGASAAIPGIISSDESNDALGTGSHKVYNDEAIPGWFRSSLYLIGGTAGIEISYLGREADNTNSFTWNAGGAAFTFTTGAYGDQNNQFRGHNSDGYATQTRTNVAPGLLNFSFTSGGPGGSVTNADNPSAQHIGGNAANFFISFGPDFGTIDDNGDAFPTGGGKIAYLWFDDRIQVAEDDDDNHDDMVIRLRILIGDGTFSTIPLPAAAWLLIAGIGGLGLVARRRKATEA